MESAKIAHPGASQFLANRDPGFPVVGRGSSAPGFPEGVHIPRARTSRPYTIVRSTPLAITPVEIA